MAANLFQDPDQGYDPFGDVEEDRRRLAQAPTSKSKGFAPAGELSDENALLRDGGTIDAMAGKESKKINKAASKPSDEYRRAIDEVEADGYFAFRTEAYHSIRGMFIKRDLLGIADIVGLQPGLMNDRPGSEPPHQSTDVLFLQLTTKEGVGAHIRKLVSSETFELSRGNPLTYKEITEKVMDAGVTIIIWGWYKDDKGRWAHSTTTVTRELLEAAIARKRR